MIHTKQRNRLAYPWLQQLVFCYYNMKLKYEICKQRLIKLLKMISLIYSTFQPSLVKKGIINYSNGLDLSIQIMKMEILIHELLHMFEKQVLMLSGFYLKKFIVKV